MTFMLKHLKDILPQLTSHGIGEKRVLLSGDKPQENIFSSACFSQEQSRLSETPPTVKKYRTAKARIKQKYVISDEKWKRR